MKRSLKKGFFSQQGKIYPYCRKGFVQSSKSLFCFAKKASGKWRLMTLSLFCFAKKASGKTQIASQFEAFFCRKSLGKDPWCCCTDWFFLQSTRKVAILVSIVLIFCFGKTACQCRLGETAMASRRRACRIAEGNRVPCRARGTKSRCFSMSYQHQPDETAICTILH